MAKTQTKILDPAEQAKIRKRAKEMLEKMEAVLDDEDTRLLIDSYKNRFNVCETVYKVTLAAWLRERGGTSEPKSMKLNMNQIPKALEFAGYSFEKSLLEKLFSSDKVEGHSSAKTLRDKVTHGLSPKAIQEIRTRRDELFNQMDSFLESIRTFDTSTEDNESNQTEEEF